MRKSHPILAGIESVKPYALVTGHSLYDIRPPAMQIEEFLSAGGVMGMTSYPGVGKTWLALEVARAIASGTPFLGRYAAVRGGVLFVGSDSSLYDYARQWTRLTKNVEDAREVFDPVRFLVQSAFMFEDRDEVRKLIRTHQKYEWGETTFEAGTNLPMRERGFHTIIFDTLSKLTRANQNDNTEMEEVFRNIRWIAEATDAAIILLHHNSKKSEFNDGADWRGAMSQIGALDSWVQLVPHRKDKYLVGVQFKKFRGITPPDFAYRMNVTEVDEASLVISSEPVTMAQRLQFDALAEAVFEVISQHPGVPASQIKASLWERFHVGVDSGELTTLQFETEGKLLSAVHARLKPMLATNRVTKTVNEKGKPVYHVVKTETDETDPAA